MPVYVNSTPCKYVKEMVGVSNLWARTYSCVLSFFPLQNSKSAQGLVGLRNLGNTVSGDIYLLRDIHFLNLVSHLDTEHDIKCCISNLYW